MNDSEMRRILADCRTVAVVGLSPDPARASYRVAAYMQEAGYRIIPVNPGCQSVLGEPCYRSLSDVPGNPEIVDIFRRSEHVPQIVEEAVAKGAKVIWMQLGVVHREAAERARQAGLAVVMDRCLLQEHARLVR